MRPTHAYRSVVPSHETELKSNEYIYKKKPSATTYFVLITIPVRRIRFKEYDNLM